MNKDMSSEDNLFVNKCEGRRGAVAATFFCLSLFFLVFAISK